MRTHARPRAIRIPALALAAAAIGLLGGVGQASAAVAPGAYVSTTWSNGTVLLQRDGYIDGNELVLIGRYPIHPTPTGGYVDFFPGHRVVMHSDGRGGYWGPAFLGSVEVGTFTLTPK